MTKNTYEQQFIEDLAAWLEMQITVNEKAQGFAAEVGEHDAEVRYESRLEAYEFLSGKILNYRQGKPFDALPDGLMNIKEY
ncbi:MAG: DUF1912 family protein [Streptococcaceae bacterium]|jgi:hypothetical protein|nr:DUF1912 family protein [Streptococcaceae bacterium]